MCIRDSNTTYSPANFHQKYAYQEITLAQAIAVSDNIYAVDVYKRQISMCTSSNL